MNEHHEGKCIHFGDAILTIGGTTRYIDVRGKQYQFEMHRWSGPIPLNKDESTRQTPWPKYVWHAVQLWIDQGKPMDGDHCVLKPNNKP